MRYGKEFGVTIDDKHSYRDLGLILTEKDLGKPEAQTNLVSVPLRDGSIDMTETLTNDIRYKDRVIKLTFYYPGHQDTWAAKFSELQNLLNGQKARLVFDDDIAFYYTGRINVNEWQSEGNIGKIVLDIICEPYKYDIASSSAEWLWDPFDFENGIINEGNITVDGTATVYFVGRRKKSYPTITVSSNMTVTYDSETFSLKKGVNKMYEIILSEGINELIFKGKGNVTIDYIGGSL